MMFQIYIPGRGPKTASVLEEVGVGEMNRHGGAMWADSLKGPDGRGIGRIVSWQTAKQDVPMQYVESWDWKPVFYDSKDTPSCYIGLNPDSMPTGDDMIRGEGDFMGGTLVEMNGINLWVPVANKLPEQVVLGLDAAHVLVIPEEERPENVPVPVSVANDFVCDALMINYKLCPAVIDALELIDDSSSAKVAIAVLEIEDIVRSFDYKKKEGSIDIPVT